MSKIKDLLKIEYDFEYDFEYSKMKQRLKKYSTPKIYRANGDLTKRWYVYYSFVNPETGKLERQAPIYDAVNSFDTLRLRNKAIKVLRDAVEVVLENGYNPFETNNTLITTETKSYNIPDATEFVLKLKKNSLKESSYKDFESRIKRFKKWLLNNGFNGRYMTDVNKLVVIQYLNHVQLESSASNRNNTRSNLSLFFQALEDNHIIDVNFISKIPVLKTKPERHKTYSTEIEYKLFEYLELHNPELLLFIKFVSYNFLRPIEVCRLKIGDIDIQGKRLFVRAKNKAVKIKIIPEILLNELPNLGELNPDNYLFSRYGLGTIWEATEVNRRDYFSKEFKDVKQYFKLGVDYGLYSFRHTFITKLYSELTKRSTPFEAKSKLMLITGHTTMGALEKYLRDIDAELPEDYSDLIKSSTNTES
jgi:integrase